MERGGGDGDAPPPSVYRLQPCRLLCEDVLFCIDVDVESQKEMKPLVPNGGPSTRMAAIQQALLLFVNSKLAINPDHRFSFATIARSVSWHRKEFSSELGSAAAAIRALTATDLSYGLADLTQLFQIVSNEAKKSREQGRLLRVILIYCRSSVSPQHQWPLSQKLFSMDAIYLHDKPSAENCPQKVYDALVDAVEHVTEYEGYVLESGNGLPRVLFRHISILLSHPQQRCGQDELDIPKSLTRKSPTSSEATLTEERTPPSSQ